MSTLPQPALGGDPGSRRSHRLFTRGHLNISLAQVPIAAARLCSHSDGMCCYCYSRAEGHRAHGVSSVRILL